MATKKRRSSKSRSKSRSKTRPKSRRRSRSRSTSHGRSHAPERTIIETAMKDLKKIKGKLVRASQRLKKRELSDAAYYTNGGAEYAEMAYQELGRAL